MLKSDYPSREMQTDNDNIVCSFYDINRLDTLNF